MSGCGKALLFAAAAAVFVGGSHAHAAEGSFAGGGVLQDGFSALKQQLAHRDGKSPAASLRVVEDDPSVIGFTPRFSRVPIGLAEGVSVDRGSLLKTRLSTEGVGAEADARALQFEQSHDLGLLKVDLSAVAGYEGANDRDLGQSSTFGFGGGLKIAGIEGLHFGASYNRQDESLGLASDSLTAGLGYDFGSLDTQLSVSNVSQYDINGIPTDEQQVWVVGGQMQFSSRLVVGGDLAYSTSLDGTNDTSGVVNFRFNF